MGIHDREYMRNRRPAAHGGSGTSNPNNRNTRFWMVGLGLGLIFLGVFAIKNDARRDGGIVP
jgi:hypothetical protein